MTVKYFIGKLFGRQICCKMFAYWIVGLKDSLSGHPSEKNSLAIENVNQMITNTLWKMVLIFL